MDKFLHPDDQHPSESSYFFNKQCRSQMWIKHEELLCQMTSFSVCSIARAHQTGIIIVSDIMMMSSRITLSDGILMWTGAKVKTG